MKVKLLSAYTEPSPNYVPSWLSTNSQTGAHRLTDDPEEADLIIFAESYASLDPYFIDVVLHPVFRRHSTKCVLYHYSDSSHTLCRTISPSVEIHQANLHCKYPFHYIARRRDNPEIERRTAEPRNPRYLFSFSGSVATHPIRRHILALQHPNSRLQDTSLIDSDSLELEAKRAFNTQFINLVLDSHFVLCPRGIGPTSMRLFETMQLGRVPVVIGDSWVPVPGIDWAEFSVFVPESEIASIPPLLESLEHRSQEMGMRARSIWEERFAPAIALDRLVEAGQNLLASPYGCRELASDIGPLLHPRHWRKLFGYWRRRAFSRA